MFWSDLQSNRDINLLKHLPVSPGLSRDTLLCWGTKSPGYYSGVNGRDELYIKEINKNISTAHAGLWEEVEERSGKRHSVTGQVRAVIEEQMKRY